MPDSSATTEMPYTPRSEAGRQYAGITVTEGRGRIETPSGIGRYPGLLEVIEERHQEGPCREAVRTHHIVRRR